LKSAVAMAHELCLRMLMPPCVLEPPRRAAIDAMRRQHAAQLLELEGWIRALSDAAPAPQQQPAAAVPTVQLDKSARPFCQLPFVMAQEVPASQMATHPHQALPIAPALVRANLTPQGCVSGSLPANAFAVPTHSIAPPGMPRAAPPTVQQLVPPAASGHAAVRGRQQQQQPAAPWSCAMSMPAVVGTFMDHCPVPTLGSGHAGMAGDRIGDLPHRARLGGGASMRPPQVQRIAHNPPPAALAQSMPLSVPPSPPATPVWSCNVGARHGLLEMPMEIPAAPAAGSVIISTRPSPLKRAHSAPISTHRSPAAQGSGRVAIKGSSIKGSSINSWLALLVCSCALFNAQISWMTGSVPGHLMTVNLALMAALIVMPVRSKAKWLGTLWCLGVAVAPLLFMLDDCMRTPAQVKERMAYLPAVAPVGALVYCVVGIVHSAQALPQQWLVTSMTMLILLLAARGIRLGAVTGDWDRAILGVAASALPSLGGYMLGKYGRRHHIDAFDRLLRVVFSKGEDKDWHVSRIRF